MPDFWFGILFILLFSTTLHWFSAGGFPSWSDPAAAMKALLLPALALALPQAAVLTRVTRSAVLEVAGEDFVRTARAKGLSARRVLWRHAVRNALVPIVTIVGLQFSFLVAGAVLVENVFNLPGIGRLAYQSLAQRDLIVIRNVAMLFAGLVITVNFLVDLAYLWLDPRLRRARWLMMAFPGAGLDLPAARPPLCRPRPHRGLVGRAVAVLSRFWTPEAPTRDALRREAEGAAGLRLAGTDAFGRDIFSMLMAGAWNSLSIAFLAVPLGVALGVGARHRRAAARRLDRGGDHAGGRRGLRLPALISAIMIAAPIGPGGATAVIAIGLFNVPVFIRVSRGVALRVWSQDFCLAAQAAGKGRLRITLDHVLPNIAGALAVQATIQVGLAILVEAGLSFLGLSLAPPAPSWDGC